MKKLIATILLLIICICIIIATKSEKDSIMRDAMKEKKQKIFYNQSFQDSLTQFITLPDNCDSTISHRKWYVTVNLCKFRTDTMVLLYFANFPCPAVFKVLDDSTVVDGDGVIRRKELTKNLSIYTYNEFDDMGYVDTIGFDRVDIFSVPGVGENILLHFLRKSKYRQMRGEQWQLVEKKWKL